MTSSTIFVGPTCRLGPRHRFGSSGATGAPPIPVSDLALRQLPLSNPFPEATLSRRGRDWRTRTWRFTARRRASHNTRQASPDSIPHRLTTMPYMTGTGGLPAGTICTTSEPRPNRVNTAPFRFWVVGDSGTGTEMQATVHREMEKYTSRQKKPPDLFIHVGDMAYFNGTDDEFHFNFFGPYGRTLRNTVFWPAMGNHEGGTSSGPAATGPYFDNFVLPANGEAGGHPSGTEAYYSYNFGNAHFVVLNSYDEDRSPGGAMAAWLTADLQQTRADWIFAYWHHAPCTKGSHDSDAEPELIEMRENFMPILEEGGVDMVFSGHSHIYERSMLIDKAYATPTIAEGVVVDDGDGDPDGDGPYRKNNGSHPHEGTVVVVTGHGGITLNRLGTMPIMKRIIYPEHGSVLIDVEGHVASGIMLNSKGKLSDTFQVVKDRRRE